VLLVMTLAAQQNMLGGSMKGAPSWSRVPFGQGPPLRSALEAIHDGRPYIALATRLVLRQNSPGAKIVILTASSNEDDIGDPAPRRN
jgi:hypothetical protein